MKGPLCALIPVIQIRTGNSQRQTQIIQLFDSQEKVRTLSAAHRSGRPEHLAGTGHAVHREEVQAFNRLLAEFLEMIT